MARWVAAGRDQDQLLVEPYFGAPGAGFGHCGLLAAQTRRYKRPRSWALARLWRLPRPRPSLPRLGRAKQGCVEPSSTWQKPHYRETRLAERVHCAVIAVVQWRFRKLQLLPALFVGLGCVWKIVDQLFCEDHTTKDSGSGKPGFNFSRCWPPAR
jgi:hypothetical protein